MGNPPISVLVVTKDRRSFVERCIYCLYNTTDPGEVIIYIWDNTSEDDTVDYLATLKQWPRIIPMRSKTNIGTEARNHMLQLVQTPYLMSIDDDVWLETPGWISAMIECFDSDSKLGGLALGLRVDERYQMGVTWEEIDYDHFQQPRFKCEPLVKTIVPLLDPQLIESPWELCGSQAIVPAPPYLFTGACAVWKTDLLKNYAWKSHAGIMSDMAGEWGYRVKELGYSLAAIFGYSAYHAVGPWWHIPDGEKAWAEKSRQAPIIYNRPEAEQWKWYEQAKMWSGWGSGIPDVHDILHE